LPFISIAFASLFAALASNTLPFDTRGKTLDDN
jgi:hypothetical protein